MILKYSDLVESMKHEKDLDFKCKAVGKNGSRLTRPFVTQRPPHNQKPQSRFLTAYGTINHTNIDLFVGYQYD